MGFAAGSDAPGVGPVAGLHHPAARSGGQVQAQKMDVGVHALKAATDILDSEQGIDQLHDRLVKVGSDPYRFHRFLLDRTGHHTSAVPSPCRVFDVAHSHDLPAC